MIRTVALPAYNEAGYIAEMVRQTIAALELRKDPFEIIVVDNASTDDTAKVVAEIAAKDKRVRLISHPENRLYAGSCLSATKAAKGDRIFILDSDGQHPPSDIWKFDAVLDEGVDLVFGRRTERAEPPMRILMSKFLWALTWYYVGFNLGDVNCGMRGFTRAYADALDIRHRVNFVNPELFVRAQLGGFKVGQVDVKQESRKAGVSSHEFGRLWKIFRTVQGYLSSLSDEIKEVRALEASSRGVGA